MKILPDINFETTIVTETISVGSLLSENATVDAPSGDGGADIGWRIVSVVPQTNYGQSTADIHQGIVRTALTDVAIASDGRSVFLQVFNWQASGSSMDVYVICARVN